jgi:hypothetical protein
VIRKFGWETIDIGGIEGARLLEPLALLWITHYFRTGNGNHAFKLLLARKYVFIERMKYVTQERLRAYTAGVISIQN